MKTDPSHYKPDEDIDFSCCGIFPTKHGESIFPNIYCWNTPLSDHYIILSIQYMYMHIYIYTYLTYTEEVYNRSPYDSIYIYTCRPSSGFNKHYHRSSPEFEVMTGLRTFSDEVLGFVEPLPLHGGSN